MQAGSGALPLAAMAALEESGFVVLPGPCPVEQLGAVDASRLGDRVSHLTREQLWGVDESLRTVLALH